MLLDALRRMCRSLPGVTEDIKWGNDLVFSVGGKMFVVVCLEPPHSVAFKCTPGEFAELVERQGIIPAPYLARALWVQEQEAGSVLEPPEMERLIRTSYELVAAKLPRRKVPAKLPKRKVARQPAELTPPGVTHRTRRPTGLKK